MIISKKLLFLVSLILCIFLISLFYLFPIWSLFPFFCWLWALLVLLFLIFIGDRLVWDFSYSWGRTVLLWTFSTELLLLRPIAFGLFLFPFDLSRSIFLFSFWFCHWIIHFLVTCCLVSMCFFCFSHFCSWFLVSNCCS